METKYYVDGLSSTLPVAHQVEPEPANPSTAYTMRTLCGRSVSFATSTALMLKENALKVGSRCAKCFS